MNWDLFVILLAIWNSYTLPVEIAFQPLFFKEPGVSFANHVIDAIFFFDIVLNFRTTYQNILTGDEVTEPKRIAINYVKGRFWIDLLSSIPFELVLPFFFTEEFSQKFILLSMLKLFRVLRLGRIITYMNESDDVKLSLRLFKVCFFLILYIHCTGCLWYYLCSLDDTWIPTQHTYYMADTPFYEMDNTSKYLISFYNSILALTGNDVYPSNNLLFTCASLLLILGALVNANIFGTIALIT